MKLSHSLNKEELKIIINKNNNLVLPQIKKPLKMHDRS